MSKNQNDNAIDALLIALGLAAVSLFFKLHLFLWRLWIVVSGLWVILVVLLGRGQDGFFDNPGVWLIIFGPPLILLAATALLAWIIDGLRR